MALILTQSDTAADSGFSVGCSGRTAGAGTFAREATAGATAGTLEILPDPGLGLQRAVLAFQSDSGAPEPNDTTWEAGNWVVRLNVTTARSNSQWTETHVCERTSGGTFNTVASLTGQTTSLATTGVKTHTVNRATDYSAAATSTIYIVIVVSDANAHGQSRVGVTPNQNIDTPIASAAEKTAAASLDAAVQAQVTRGASLDAGLAEDMERTAGLDATVRAPRSQTATLDAAVRSGQARPAQLDAAVRAGALRAMSLDAVLATSASAALGLDGIIRQTGVSDVGLDAAVRNLKPVAAGLDAALQTFKPLSAGLDAGLAMAASAPISLDAAVRRTQGASLGLDAVLQGGSTFTPATGRTHEVAPREPCEIASRDREFTVPPGKRRH